ncbi:hypothetical protein ACFL25_00755 [Patescibacteria group bacterium]
MMTAENIERGLQPRFINENEPGSSEFLKVVGFCDRDEGSHAITQEGESYKYCYRVEPRYEVIKRPNGLWGVDQFGKDGNKIAFSTGPDQDRAIYHALIAPVPGWDDTVDIIFPVFRDQQKNISRMFYVIGGYPGYFITDDERRDFIKLTGVPEHAHIVTFRKVPKDYLPWLIEGLAYLKMTEPDKVFSVHK